ncbi:MAG: phosphoglucosamine mutase [Polyangiales bacterium]
MSRKLFGTDGVRGPANQGVMTPEIAFRIGAAVTYQASRRVKHPPRIVIGTDTRVSGYLFEASLAAGVCALGGRVMLSGPLPTPAVAHLTTSMRADAGVVISASHNPFEDNGIKIFAADGFKLPDEAEMEIEQLIASDTLDKTRPRGKNVGRAERLDDAPGRYVAYVKQTFPQDLTLEGMRIVIDAAHGAAYKVAPAVFQELGAEVIAIGVRPDGQNINRRCGATHPETCAHEVVRKKAHVGICLDGDADRLIVVDENGKTVDGDAVMSLVATRLLRANKLKRRTLVTTVMSNLGLERAVAAENGKLLRCAVGDRYVVDAMRKSGLNFGGEQSGHLIFLDHATTGDGLVAALQVLAIATREQKTISELAGTAIERVPQVLVNATFPTRKALDDMPLTQRAIKDAEKKLNGNGRVLVRWSGTEAKLRIMIEGPSPDRIKQMAEGIAAEAKRDIA